MVMIGSLFAAHEESPGGTVELDGKNIKEYFGSASEYQKVNIRTLKVKMFVEHKDLLKIPLLKWNKIYRVQFHMREKDLKSLRTVDYVIVRNSIFNGDRD